MLRKFTLMLFLFGICFSPLFSLNRLCSHDVVMISMIHDPHSGSGGGGSCGGGGGGGSFNFGKGRGGKAPKGGHKKNIRPSTKEKHENADARRQKEQKKAQEKKRK